jgi:4-diphosphocytidyl-2-C-methyl-D-erythritol kinase
VILQEQARAKVNLYLHVVGKRADGYHLLDSLAVFPDIADRLSAIPAPQLSLSLTGAFGESLVAEPDNLVLRAARALQLARGVMQGAQITLEKNLPVASGIGGGSADAAAALRLLCRLWKIAPPPSVLAAISAGLGADVPVCLDQTPARMQGVGDILATAPDLPSCGMVLINPGIGVPTPAVFRARTGAFRHAPDLPDHWPDATAMAHALAGYGNDLEAPSISLCPVIADVLDSLKAHPDCLMARMSGSGATCFGLFQNPETAARAATDLAHPGWWVWGGNMLPDTLREAPGLPETGLPP